MRYLFYLIAVAALLSGTGCVVPGDREREGHVGIEGKDHVDHGDRHDFNRDHDDLDGPRN